MIIQRWQNFLLLLAAILMACFSFCSIAQIQTPDFTLDFTSLGLRYEGEPSDGAPSGYRFYTWYLFILSIMSVIIPVLGIVSFKNLKLQRKICAVSVLFTVVTAVVAGTLAYTAEVNAQVDWASPCVAPLFSIFAVILAYGRIRSDEKKLRSADRLR